MATIINGSIDLSKLDKSKIVTTDKGGKYYNVTILINDDKDKFGNDVSITTGQTKEERQNKEKKHYIGNGKVVWNIPKATKENDTDVSDVDPF